MTEVGGPTRSPPMRPYAPEDREACLALFDSNVPDFFRPQEREEYVAWLDNPGGPVVVLLDDVGGILAAGGVALEDDGETGSLCWGIVRRDLHGRGLGRTLLEARLGLLAADPACRRVRLSTIAGTVGFFEKLGFRTLRVDADGHGSGTDAYEMSAELTDEVRARLRGPDRNP